MAASDANAPDGRTFQPGDIVQHFKRELVDPSTSTYLYRIVGVAQDSETDDPVMVYRALYGDGRMYVRPLDMFMSEVDHGKYPDIKQRYRFEPVKQGLS